MKQLSLLNWLGLITIVFALVGLTGESSGEIAARSMPAPLDALCFLFTGLALLMPAHMAPVYRFVEAVEKPKKRRPFC